MAKTKTKSNKPKPNQSAKETTPKRKLSKLSIITLIVSIFFSIIGFFLTIYAIIDIRNKNRKGLVLCIIAMIVSIIKLIAIIYILNNYNTISNKLIDYYKEHTITTTINNQLIQTSHYSTEIATTTTTTKYSGPTTQYNKENKFNSKCYQIEYIGYCEEGNVDENGDTLCHYYEISDDTSADVKEIDIRCPLYYINANGEGE